ncbi:MAG TPA: trigger factor [Gemmataceae bacterium]|nr:trigger factor [Gemmataceae bacterium]
MTDEKTPQEAPESPEGQAQEHEHVHEHEHEYAEETATATAPVKLQQTVDIRDVGPCKKHITVTVDRKDIDGRFSEKISELVSDANVSGFRPGKAPRRIVERRFHKEVGDQVKSEVLLASLQQLAEDFDIAPLSAPDIDPANIELPRQGPLVYEFEVEVRPQFDLPNYRGLKIRRPVHTFTDEEVAQEERRLLTPYGQIVPKSDGEPELGDLLVVDAVIKAGDREIGKMSEATLRVNKQLAFKDGVAENFAEEVKGAKAGDTREIHIKLSSAVADPELRGETVTATLNIKDVKTVVLPELTHDFLHTFGVHSPEQLRELLQVILQRRLEYQQRQSARKQVMELITAASTWELPVDLLRRQAGRAMSRRIMEMRADGISEEEIKGRRRLLEQDILESTKQALKEHFVLQKLAEVEKIDVNDDDLNDEIERIAEQDGESPRRVRARLEREDLLEALAAEMIERKALDLILESAEYEDVPLGQEDQPSVSMVEAQAVPGEIHDPTAEPPATEETNPAPSNE